MKRAVILAAAALGLGGCTLQDAYVAADRATYEAIAPEYLEYVEADAALEEEQRDRRRETVRAWQARLEEGLDQ